MQDKYHKRLTDNGYDLERRIKGSDRKHIKIKEYKRIYRELEQKINVRSDRLTKEFEELDKKIESSKSIPFDKKHVIVDKDTLNKVINESKKIKELEPKIKEVFNEVNNYADSYKSLEQENNSMKNEVKYLKRKNDELEAENRGLIYRLNYLFELLKKFLRKLLQKGNDYTKDETVVIVKDCYDENEFDMNDVVGISRGTAKQDELFEYVEAPDYLKERVKDYEEYDKNDFDLSR